MSASRIYDKKEVIAFRSTKGAFGGLSNMAPGYTLHVNGIFVPTVEALYQACRFPNYQDIQHEIIIQNSPMTAKGVSRKYDKYTRPDWNQVRIDVMRWCLKIKLSQNWELFSQVLKQTENKPIVEYTKTDKVWGATDASNGKLEGINALGRLLMQLREEYVHTNNYFRCVNPLEISDFLLYDNPIDWVCDETNNIYELGIEKEEEHYHLTA